MARRLFFARATPCLFVFLCLINTNLSSPASADALRFLTANELAVSEPGCYKNQSSFDFTGIESSAEWTPKHRGTIRQFFRTNANSDIGVKLYDQGSENSELSIVSTGNGN